MFKQSGGRLFHIATLFTGVSVITLVIMAVFTYIALQDVKEIATTIIHEGEKLPDMSMFYSQLIVNLKFGTVIGSLSGVLIAVAARYGFRETSDNIGKGMVSKASQKPDISEGN